MRITTASNYAATIDNLQLRQQGLSDAQARLSSGKRVLRASDDPAAAARAERALAAESRSDASKRSVDASKVLIGQTESALRDANEWLSQAREALVASGNASYSDAERAIQANKIQGLRDQLFVQMEPAAICLAARVRTSLRLSIRLVALSSAVFPVRP